MTIINARKADPTMPEAPRSPATATTTPAMLNSTSNPRGSANARSATRDRGAPSARASTADTGRSGSGDGDDVDGMSITVKASIGIALTRPEDGENASEHAGT